MEPEISIYRSQSDTASGMGAGFDFFVSTRAGVHMSTCGNWGGVNGVRRNVVMGVELLKNCVEQKLSSLTSLKMSLSQGVYPNLSL